MAKTSPVARNGRFKGYKTSNLYDSTDWNPQWLVA
jgi:hypothetical protein